MKRPIKYKGKEITIRDFVPVIPDSQVKAILGKRNSTNFYKWMSGQTRMMEGVYPCDLQGWLEHGKIFD